MGGGHAGVGVCCRLSSRRGGRIKRKKREEREKMVAVRRNRKEK